MLVLSGIVIVVKSPESIIIGNRILIYIFIIIMIIQIIIMYYNIII